MPDRPPVRPGAGQPDEQRWLRQTKAGGGDVPPEERGDCVAACVASILGLPLSAIHNGHGDGWWDRLQRDAGRHGYAVAGLDISFDPPDDLYWIASVPSLNLPPDPDGKPALHCVVVRGRRLVHDPGLGDLYDEASWVQAWNDDKVTEGWVLAPLDPASQLELALSRIGKLEEERDRLLRLAASARSLVSRPLLLDPGNKPLAEADRLLALARYPDLGDGLKDGPDERVQALEGRLQEAEKALGAITKFLTSPHSQLGDACGFDACLACLAEKTAEDALAHLRTEEGPSE